MGFSDFAALWRGRTGWWDAHRRVGTQAPAAESAVDVDEDRGLRRLPDRLAKAPVRAVLPPEAQDFRRAVRLGHAGSWRGGPSRCGSVRRFVESGTAALEQPLDVSGRSFSGVMLAAPTA